MTDPLDPKLTNRPSGVIDGPLPGAMVSVVSTEMAIVVGEHPDDAPLQVSRRYVHEKPAFLPQTEVLGSMFVALESKAT